MTLHDHAQFEELVARAVEEKPAKPVKARKPRAKVVRAAKVPAAPRAHYCDCTAERSHFLSERD